MIIDTKGRLFGKVNIIDLCILLVLIAAAVFAYKKFGAPTKAAITGGAGDEFVLTLSMDEVKTYVTDTFQVGTPVEDADKNIDLGTVTNFELGPGFEYNADSNGKVVKGYREDYSSAVITTTLKATGSPMGIIISGNKYNVGQNLSVRIGKAKIYLQISDIQPKGADGQ